MQESRLFRMIYHLINNGSSTAPKLAELFEVSIRTIYRDLDVISSAGIPIYTTQGKGGGIFIAKDFILDKSLLSTKEKEQVLMALQGIDAIENKANSELLSKLGSLFQAKNTNWIEVDFSSWIHKDNNPDLFQHIKEAIFDKKILQFSYYGNTHTSSHRNVAPLKLVFKSKDWYLYAFCLTRNDYRFFKLTRMKNLVIQTETYSQDIEVPTLLTKQIQMEPTISTLLKFDPCIAFRIYDEFSDAVTTDDFGYLLVSVDLPDNDTLYSYLLSFGNYVEIIEPLEVRERMKRKVIEIAKKYKT